MGSNVAGAQFVSTPRGLLQVLEENEAIGGLDTLVVIADRLCDLKAKFAVELDRDAVARLHVQVNVRNAVMK